MKIVDLFAGCGGLAEGFRQKGFHSLAFVEWNKHCIETLKANYKENNQLPHPLFYETDIRNFDSYLRGNVNCLIEQLKGESVDGIIGGPPCQAYSLAGRIRDPNGMRDDYRNFLFEAYAQVIREIKPRFFVFENVSGMLSAKPGGTSVVSSVGNAFRDLGYSIPPIDKNIIFDLKKMGGPQNRKRVLIFGVRKDTEKDSVEKMEKFYHFLQDINETPQTVGDAINDLPKFRPLKQHEKRKSHRLRGNEQSDTLHTPRYHNKRDIAIFKELAEDKLQRNPKFQSIDALKKLYEEQVGKSATVHKYYVLNRNSQSNLIPAHLYKDGLRHIHPDPRQARSITAREAARLQTFSDEYTFKGPMGEIYKMIGNAVAPLMSEKIAVAVHHAFSNK